MTMNDLDVVRLRQDMPVLGLRAGETGTILHVFTWPNIACEVEFSDELGQARAQVPLLESQLDLVEAWEDNQRKINEDDSERVMNRRSS